MAAGLLFACSTTSSNVIQPSRRPVDPEVQELYDRYLAASGTPEALKAAIRRGEVVEGMCPLEAFAAAGLPGPYMVKRDSALWTSDVPPPDVIEAQCSHPDESVIEVMFRNKTQFPGGDAQTFRVRFVKGKVTLVDRKGFKE
jgi:hypothetical protein